ncbi:MAG: hypothetical protein R3C15_15640 [Thermoleophilia bacterium]
MSSAAGEISTERGLYRVWLGLPIERYAPCSRCGRCRSLDDRPLLVRGRRRDHLACFDCFARPRRRGRW